MARHPASPAVTQKLLDRVRRHNLGHLLLALGNDFEQRVLLRYAAIGHGDVRPAHGSVLRNVEFRGTRLTRLARHAGVTHRAMAKIVIDLQRLGYIERRAAVADGRATLVFYSRHGRKLIRDSRGVIEQIYDEYAHCVGADNLMQLEQLLARAVNKLGIAVYRGGQLALAQAPEKITTDRPGEHLSHSLGRYLAEMSRDYHGRCADLMAARGHRGIRFDHLAVLSHLDVAGMDHSRLAERGGISLQAIGKQVRAVHRLGYVVSEVDPADRRVRRVRFTARGMQFIHDLLVAFDQIETDYAALLGRRDLCSMQRQLDVFVERLQLRIPAPQRETS